jgi:APA family basic amino acid/polyamine antiporter
MTLLALFANLTNVVAIGTFAMIFYYGVSNVAALKLPKEHRKYPSSFPLLGTISCLIFLIFALSINPQTWITGLVGLGAGAIYYLVLKHIHPRTKKHPY